LGAEINERLDVDAALESREGGVAHPGARGVLCDVAEVHVDVCSLIVEIQERQQGGEWYGSGGEGHQLTG
jgi:hypothetical protein